MLQSENSFHTAWQKRRKARLRNERIKRYAGIILSIAMAFALMCALAKIALAGDPTGYWAREIEAGRAPPAEWWHGLANKKQGLCCSHADGLRLDNVDWDAKDGHYRVYFRGVTIATTVIPDGWVDVPDDAVVETPNKYGPAVVWPYIWMRNGVEGAGIRCFMPGAGA
jgi:hypothetical protein